MSDVEEWDGRPVPVERWGSDHWSTFAYVETRIVDHDGFLDGRHMRGHTAGWERYPTRLKDGELSGHNDFDCVDDAIAAGLLIPAGKSEGLARITKRNAEGEIVAMTHRYQLTSKGSVVAAKLRTHKGNGGNWGDFDPGPVLGWMAAASRRAVSL